MLACPCDYLSVLQMLTIFMGNISETLPRGPKGRLGYHNEVRGVALDITTYKFGVVHSQIKSIQLT